MDSSEPSRISCQPFSSCPSPPLFLSWSLGVTDIQVGEIPYSQYLQSVSGLCFDPYQGGRSQLNFGGWGRQVTNYGFAWRASNWGYTFFFPSFKGKKFFLSSRILIGLFELMAPFKGPQPRCVRYFQSYRETRAPSHMSRYSRRYQVRTLSRTTANPNLDCEFVRNALVVVVPWVGGAKL